MITFNDNEDYCRWNGILCTPEYLEDIMGIDPIVTCPVNKSVIITGHIQDKYVVLIKSPNERQAIVDLLEFYSREDFAISPIPIKVVEFDKELIDDILNFKLLTEEDNINIEKCIEFSNALEDWSENNIVNE